jgi:hypothetical protein
MSGFGFTKMFSERWRKVPDGVLGGYCRGTVMVWSTCRVLLLGDYARKELRRIVVVEADVLVRGT